MMDSGDFLKNASFVHLHNHTQFSVLQATSRINQLIDTAAKDGMSALAITDHGNLMGAFHFIKATNLYNSKLEDQEKKGILSIFKSPNGLIEKSREILMNPKAKKETKQKSIDLFKNKIDINIFFYWLISNHPNNVIDYKNN